MPNVNVNVKNKIATGDGSIIVCDNSDYIVNFIFDDEWENYPTKTMRVDCGDSYADVIFEGNSCNLPIVSNVSGIKIGVYAGDLRTTTPAYVDCKKSIMGENGRHETPEPDVYNRLLEEINKIEKGSSTTLRKNNPSYVAQMIGIAKSYYEARDDINGQKTFSYGYRSALDKNFISGDNTIDCSSFVGLVLRGIAFKDSPYSVLLETPEENDEDLTGQDDEFISDDSNATDNGLDQTKDISKNLNYDWTIDPYDYKNLKNTQDQSESQVRTASQLAQWFFESDCAIDFKNDFSNVEVGDIIFYSKKDRNGNYTQPNRWKNISHVSIVVNKFENDDTSLNYPYKHTMLEVTTIGKIVLNRTLEKVTPEYITMICRPQLGDIQLNRQIGNVNNINNLFNIGDYYLTSSVIEGLPLRYNNGIGLHLKVEKSITRYGRDYTIIQTLTDTKNNITWKRTQYCYTNSERYIADPNSWTDWVIISKVYDSRDLKNISSLSEIGQIVPIGCEMNIRVTSNNVLYGEIPIAQNGVLIVKHIYNSGNDDIILLRYILTGTTYEEYATSIYNSTIRAWVKII